MIGLAHYVKDREIPWDLGRHFEWCHQVSEHEFIITDKQIFFMIHVWFCDQV